MSSERKPRSDKGQVRATERDLKILRFIGEQYAIRFDQLKELIELYEGESRSKSTVKRLCARWERAGWIEKQKLLANDPPWVWLTRKGLSDAGLDYPYRAPSLARLNHIYYVNVVRLYVERRGGDKVKWRSDRLVNLERKAEKKKHIVDGEVLYQDTTIAIEVELARKSTRRLTSILWELQRDYEAVYYFATPTCYQSVKETIEDIPNYKKIFVLYDLLKILAGDEQPTKS